MSNEGKVAIAQGRIVWVSGNGPKGLFEGKPQTIFGTQTPKLNLQGEQTTQYGFGLAVPKSELADPVRGAIWAAMYEQAYSMFPSRVVPPAFAMKYKDGDGVDDEGKPFSQREGYAGCLVFALTSNLVIRFFRHEGGQNIQVSDGIKCGDYVEVQVMVKAHPAIGQGKAGLYLNPMAVRLVAPGKEIINAPTGDMIFGNTMPGTPSNYVPPEQPAMPAFQPPPGNGVPAVGYPSMPGALPPPAPMMAAPPAYPSSPAPVPHYGVVPPAFQPPPGGLPAAPAMPVPAAPAGHPAYGGGMPPIPR